MFTGRTSRCVRALHRVERTKALSLRRTLVLRALSWQGFRLLHRRLFLRSHRRRQRAAWLSRLFLLGRALFPEKKSFENHLYFWEIFRKYTYISFVICMYICITNKRSFTILHRADATHLTNPQRARCS